MRIPHFLQHEEIVSREQTTRGGDHAASDDRGDFGGHAPDALLSGVDVDDGGQETCDGVQEGWSKKHRVSGGIRLVKRGKESLQEDFIHQPDIILPPAKPQKQTAHPTDHAEDPAHPEQAHVGGRV